MPAKTAESERAVIGTAPVRQDALDAFLERHEGAVVVLLCILAALRVFIFCAGFPASNNVDERQHLDVVCSYAQGIVPDHLSHFSQMSSEILANCATPEYVVPNKQFAHGQAPPPMWTLPQGVAMNATRSFCSEYRRMVNTEATQPPVYYAAAAAWTRLGMLFGIRDGQLFYWIRFLNIPIAALLVWVTHFFVRRLYPTSTTMKIGLPLMIAFIPQDALYSITNDVFSPLLFCISFFLLLDFHRDPKKSHGWYALTGLCVAATFLTKYSNVGILVLLGAILCLALPKLRRSGKIRQAAPGLAVLLIACLLPIAAWTARDYFVLHDWTGTAAKTQALGWRPASLSEISAHPMLSPRGLYVFFRDLVGTFWRGEITWQGQRVASPAADSFYCISTLLFLTAAAVSAFGRRSLQQEGRSVIWMSSVVLTLSVILLAGISVGFNFGNCFYPSSSYPYCTSGRLIFGCIVPFLLLYVSGLDHLLTLLRIRVSRVAVLVLVAVVMTWSEVLISAGAFTSAYNWFHMP